MSDERQVENENKKDGKMVKGLDRCVILSQQMVELEDKGNRGRERNRERQRESDGSCFKKN